MAATITSYILILLRNYLLEDPFGEEQKITVP